MQDSEKTREQLLEELANARNDVSASRRLISLAEDRGQIGHWKVDIVNDVLFWSARVYEIHGRDPQTFTPEVASAILHYHPDDRATVEQCMARAIEFQEDFDFELRIVRPNGEVRRVLASGRPEFNGQRALISIIGIFRDVTEARIYEDALRQSNERNQAHLDHTPLGVIEWSADMRVLEWNSRCEEIFGYTKAEAMGQSGADLILRHADRSDLVRVFQRILTGEGGLHNINRNTTKDGRMVLCEWHNTPLYDEHGVAVAVASICQDITEVRRVEEQLAQSQKMEALGTLAGGIAHDMNNVLAVVMGLGSLVEVTLPSDHPSRKDMTQIVAAAGRGRSMVQQLLGYARKRTQSQVQWHPQVVIASTLSLLEKTLPKGVQIHAEVDDAVSVVLGDEDAFTTALMNLCINAAQAMDGTGTIIVSAQDVRLDEDAVRLYPGLAAGRFVRLQVADNGAGMDEQTRKRAFEPFYTTRSQGNGTGLGLSQVYGTVQSHKGTVTIESEVGTGTTLSILLPALEGVVALDTPTAAPPTVSGTLLIIDDEPMIIRGLERMSSMMGVVVVGAEGGEQGIAEYRQRHLALNLVLLDLSMPGMNGRVCFDRLREIDDTVPIVISTGDGDSTRAEQLVADGAVAILRKPFSLNELQRVIGEYGSFLSE